MKRPPSSRKSTRRIASDIAASLALVFSLTATAAADVRVPDPLSKVASLAAPSMETARTQTLEAIAAIAPAEEARQKAEASWPTGEPEEASAELLDRVARALAAADPRIADLAEACSKPRTDLKHTAPEWLDDESVPAFIRNNMKLYYGRWLVHERLYDEAAVQLTELKPEEVVDPAGLLFFQGVTHHRLLHKEQGLAALDRLLTDVVDPPERYKTLAALMQHDLKQLEDESLDHIARRMEDVKRRLDLGRAGKKTREVEDGVIESLDKMIEQLEKQQQQQQQASQSQSGGRQPTQPMQDSQIAGGKGKGETRPRDIGDTADWGDLPAKEREEALQQIGRDFPAHYRDVVEQYFRKLATEQDK